MSTLFRPEALEGQRQSWLGEVRRICPLPLTVLSVWAVGVAVPLLGLAFVGEYTRKTQLSGSLESAGADAEPAQLRAVLCATPSTVGLLRPDQPVLLRYEALGRQSNAARPSGRVVSVARTPVPASLCAGEPAAVGSDTVQARYRVTVALDAQTAFADGRAQPLAPGMRVDAVVLLERRRIVDWLFEPATPGGSG